MVSVGPMQIQVGVINKFHHVPRYDICDWIVAAEETQVLNPRSRILQFGTPVRLFSLIIAY